MKEVMAIIRMNMMNKTKKMLAEAGIPSVTAGEALGRGKGLVDMKVLAGAEEGFEEAISVLGQAPRLIPKRFMSLIVPDALVETTVKLIIEANQTGQPGDGKIFILPVSDAVRVRTGENGDAVLDSI